MSRAGVLLLLMRLGAARRAIVLPGLIALIAACLAGCSNDSGSAQPITISAGSN
jgi:hypothetical protein